MDKNKLKLFGLEVVKRSEELVYILALGARNSANEILNTEYSCETKTFSRFLSVFCFLLLFSIKFQKRLARVKVIFALQCVGWQEKARKVEYPRDFRCLFKSLNITLLLLGIFILDVA